MPPSSAARARIEELLLRQQESRLTAEEEKELDYLARQLRLALELGKPLGPGGAWLFFDPVLYLIVPFTWLVVFVVLSVYDTRRTLRFVDDLQTVTQATTVATLVLLQALGVRRADLA